MNRDRTQTVVPDLFSLSPPTRAPSSATATDAAATPSSSRYILPKDLPDAITKLAEEELDQLHAAVLAELQRRGKKPPSNENIRKRRVEETAVPLTIGKLNAIRAAFKAGITPSRIARQFRISQSDVRKALVGIASKKPQSGNTTTSDVES
jgi:predicted DNA-binding protein (UPF0251 family)